MLSRSTHTVTKSNKYALISVSLKKGVVDVAKFLVDNGFILIATPGTGDILRVANVPFVATAEIVGSGSYCFIINEYNNL